MAELFELPKMKYLLPLLAAVVFITSCHDQKQAEIKGTKADSIIFAAGDAQNYKRLLALTDSFERSGDISDVNANRWRGVGYYYQGQMLTAEFYYQKVVSAEIKNEQDLLNYNKSARRLATLLVIKGDYEGALRVAVPAVTRMEESGKGTPSDIATLLNTIGCCQLNLSRPQEAAASFDRSYHLFRQAIAGDSTGRHIYSAFISTNNTIDEYISAKMYAEALPWIDRTQELLHVYELLPNVDPKYPDEFKGRIHLNYAIAQQGLGRPEEAAEAYKLALTTDYGKSVDGRITANAYLLKAERYKEAADNYRDLDVLFSKKGIRLSLNNIREYLLPKYRANVGAQRKEEALAAGEQICEALDTAIIHAKLDDAAELATIYDTQQKEAQIAHQQADLSRQRMVAMVVALVLVVLIFMVYTLVRRKAAKKLADAHSELKKAYDQLEETTAIKERIESELRIARDIQQSMVPKVFPNRQGLDLYASMTPAKEVGGDLYGYLILDDELYFCIGDVSGKGVPASLFMAQATRLFRTLAAQHMMPAEIATRMNAALTEDNEQGMFVTMFIGLANLTTGHLNFCNAGHNPPIIKEGTAEPRFIEMESNAPLGLWPGIKFVGEEIDSILDSPLFIYTDGLNEAENREQQQFGDDRLLDTLSQLHANNAREVVEALEMAVKAHRDGANPNDDLTMMCLNIFK